ncbi:tRNA-dihydrouridine(20a/20b) synthase [NAD(P)+]-like, partial [Nibea albiflora]
MKTSNGDTSIMGMFEKGKVLKICAPMVRYSKLAFRSLVRKYNCDICFTPMIVASDFMRSVKARDSEFTTNEPCVVAPFSDGVDLNCGCPQRWAMSAGYGACLINKPELVKDMVRHVRNQVDNPNYTASIKIRIHKDLRQTVDLCQKAESAGVSWITVHGRTSEERHQPVHYDAIKTIKDSVSVPVIANGDIKYLRDVESTHKAYRSQRNLYISGFAVFLWLVMKRVVTLINQLASVSNTTAALQAQADGANQAAKKYMEDNELLKQTLMEAKGDKATAEGMELLRTEVKKLKEELKTSGDALGKSQTEADVIKKQMDGLAREYDRLLTEHQELQ